MTAVGPPDWPITALPERSSGTDATPVCGARECPGALRPGKAPSFGPHWCDGAGSSKRGGSDAVQDRNLAGTAICSLEGHLRHAPALDADRRQNTARADPVAQSLLARRSLRNPAWADHVGDSLWR